MLFTENGRPVFANAKGLNKRGKQCGFKGSKLGFLWAHRLLNIRGYAFCKDARVQYCAHCSGSHGADPWSVFRCCKAMQGLRAELEVGESLDKFRLVDISRVLRALKALKSAPD